MAVDATKFPKEVLYYGEERVAPERKLLKAGPLTCLFDPENGFLRYVRLGDHEVVRAIYGAVRDRDWGTVAPEISDVQIVEEADRFNVSFQARCRGGGVDFAWTGRIAGEADGRISFEFDGEARSGFERNRIGLCVLHPIEECAGKPCRVEKVDGTAEEGAFPRFIKPDQCFTGIRAVSHEVALGMGVEVRFEGEVFEMEDQRNWTDASFKTYSTPLALPFPVRIEPESRVRQSVVLTLTGPQRKIFPVLQGRSPQLSVVTTPVLAKPAIGLALARDGAALTGMEIERLKQLGLSHLRVDLRLSRPDFPERLRQAAREAEAVGTGLHIALHLTENAPAELDQLAAVLESVRPRVAVWLVFHESEAVTDEKWTRPAREKLSRFCPAALFAAGSKANFVDLNRNRPPSDGAALPMYGITPQVHMPDNATLVENLGAQAATVESTEQFSPRPVVISPVTLRPRFEESEGADSEGATGLPPDVDVRQMSLFGAGWTLGSIARLAPCRNLHSVTYYETTGWRGIMEREKGAVLPEGFWSWPGAVYPVFHVFADLAGYDRFCITPSSHPLEVIGLTLLNARTNRRILAANLAGHSLDVKIKTGSGQARVWYLDETNVKEAMRSPEEFRAREGALTDSVSGKVELKLRPYGLARVEMG